MEIWFFFPVRARHLWKGCTTEVSSHRLHNHDVLLRRQVSGKLDKGNPRQWHYLWNVTITAKKATFWCRIWNESGTGGVNLRSVRRVERESCSKLRTGFENCASSSTNRLALNKWIKCIVYRRKKLSIIDAKYCGARQMKILLPRSWECVMNAREHERLQTQTVTRWPQLTALLRCHPSVERDNVKDRDVHACLNLNLFPHVETFPVLCELNNCYKLSKNSPVHFPTTYKNFQSKAVCERRGHSRTHTVCHGQTAVNFESDSKACWCTARRIAEHSHEWKIKAARNHATIPVSRKE